MRLGLADLPPGVDIALQLLYGQALHLRHGKLPSERTGFSHGPCGGEVAETFTVSVARSDLCAGLVGGLGVVPGANIGDQQAVFEAVHGSAPDIAGQGLANPVGTILAGALMLDWLDDKHDDPDLARTAQRIRTAVTELYAAKKILTRDLGGTATTDQVTKAVCRALS